MVSKRADCALGLSIDLSISVQSSSHQQQQKQQQRNDFFFHSIDKKIKQGSSDEEGEGESERGLTPLQLDLLPRPIARKKNAGLLWQSLFSKSRESPSDSTVTEAPNNNSIKAPTLDMNQMPCLGEAAEDISTSFQLMEPGRRLDHAKRERESDEVEQMTLSSRAASDEEEGGTRKKLRLSKEQSALLEESFREHSTLNPKQKNALAKQLNLRPRQVEVWFQNRRARTKLKQTEVDCELLKKYCEGLSEENRRLQKELQELRALKISPPCVITHDFYMPLPATTLTMCPSCERLATVDSSNVNTNNGSRNGSSNNKPTTSFHNTATPVRYQQQPSLLQPV